MAEMKIPAERMHSMKLKPELPNKQHIIPTPAVQVTVIMAAMIMKAVMAVITMTGATMIHRLMTRFLFAEQEPLSYKRIMDSCEMVWGSNAK